MLRTDLRTWLLGSAPIVAIVGTAGVYSSRPDQGANRPYVVLNLISAVEGITLDGGDGALDARIQVDAWADDETVAETLIAAVRNRLHGYRGAWGARAIAFVILEASADQYTAPADATDVTPYRRTRDFVIGTTEPVPTGL